MSDIDPKTILTLLTLVVLIGLVTTQALFRMLKIHHPDAFAEIGSPHLILNNTPSNTFKYLRFLYLGKFKLLSSGAISLLCYMLYFLHLGLLICMVSYPLSLR